MFGKRRPPIRAVIVAQLLLLSASQALASADSDWLRMAQHADDLRHSNDYNGSRDYWIKALEHADNQGTLNPWTTIALRNITEISLSVRDIDTAEKYSVRYVVELEKLGKDYPDLAHALILRGEILAIRKQFDRSTECLSRAYKIAHDSPIDVADRSDALLYLSANYEVLKDRKNSNRCKKELIDTLAERRGTAACQKVSEYALHLANFSEYLPETEKKCYFRVARGLCAQIFIDSARLGNLGFSATTVLLRMSDISAKLGEPERAYSELMKAKIACGYRDSRVSADDRAGKLSEIALCFSKSEHFIEAAQCFNSARALTEGKKFNDWNRWYLNRQAGEVLIKSADFKRAKESFLESIAGWDKTSERAYSLARLAECEVRLDNSQESDRYLNLAIQEALKEKKAAAKANSPKAQENLAFIKNGFNELTVSLSKKFNPKAAARVHAFGLSLLEAKTTDMATEYLWQGALELESRNIANAEKSMDTAFSIAKFSLDEPEVISKNPETDLSIPDDRRWKYLEYFRLKGLCALCKNDSKTAIKLFQHYLILSAQQKWIRGRNYCKFNAAMAFLQVKLLNDSRRLFKEVIDYTERHEDVKDLAEFRLTNYFWLAVATCEDGDYDEASRYCQRAVELSEKSADRSWWLPATDALKGRIQSLTGHHKEAQNLFDRAKSAMNKRMYINSQDYANVLYWQLEDHLAQNQDPKARELAKQAVSLYEKRNAHAFTYESKCRKILGK